jgi:hypothetical protein
MPNLILALAIIAGGYWLLRKFAATPPSGIQPLLRKLGGAGLMALAGFLFLRGAIDAAIPIFVVGAGLYGLSSGFPGFGWSQRTAGQRSRVETSLLTMELDHDSGKMDGVVRVDPFKGRSLSTLSDAELRQLYKICGSSGDQSLALLQAWLDRSYAGWRERWQAGQSRAAPDSSSRMSREEAHAVLGLKPGASEADIRAAHRRLMKEFHPDRGGSDYLAAKINQAKDVLLHP